MARELKIEQPFDLGLSLTMGQAFRWQKMPDGWFSGVLGEHLIHIRQNGGVNGPVEYRAGGPDGERDAKDSDDEMLRRYFREDQGVRAAYAEISRDPYVAELVAQYPGMRILRQEPWECLVAYICSANNNIPRISSIVERISDAFGAEVELDGEQRRTFPQSQRFLADPDAAETLARLKLGLRRAPNILDAAQRVAEGQLALDDLAGEPYSVAKAELMKCRGVGNKIADCIALFSLDKLDAFPVDLHIGRSLMERYDCPLSQNGGNLTKSTYRKTVDWALEHFGPYCGLAGQHLFYAQLKGD